MIKKHLFTLPTLLCVAWIATSWPPSLASAQESTADFMQLSLQEIMDADAQAVNVLGTHTHLAGKWMLGYRYMSMHMEGNRDGTKDIDVNRMLQDFRLSPTDMMVEMHMAEIMYAPTDSLTWMAIFPYLRASPFSIQLDNFISLAKCSMSSMSSENSSVQARNDR